MKKNKLSTIKKPIFFMYALSLFFLGGYCYFRWDTYPNKVVSAIVTLIHYSAPLLLMLYVLTKGKKRHKIKTKDLVIIVLAIVVIIHTAFLGTQYKLLHYGDIEFVFLVLALLFLSKDDSIIIFDYLVKIFAIIILPSLIYFILETVGIRFPSSLLQSEQLSKSVIGIYYERFPFGLIVKQAGWISRYCGIFDEAGFVGTFCALFLAASYRRIDKKWSVLLLIEGIFSLSMAFYLLLGVFIIVRGWINGAFKFVGICLVLIVGFIIFVNIDFKNESIAHIQSRIDLSSNILVEDNRLNKRSSAAFERFVSDGGTELLFGKGRNANVYSDEIGGSSYKLLIYDHGIIGTMLYYGFFVVYAWLTTKFKKSTLPFLAVFVASVYQRPYIFNKLYFTTFSLSLITIMTIEEIKTSFPRNNGVNLKI